MSSGTFETTGTTELYRWEKGLNRDEFVLVTYEVVSLQPVEPTALAIAMEQSAAGSTFPHFNLCENFADLTAKVVSCEEFGLANGAELGTFDLATEVYSSAGQSEARRYRLCIAYPLSNTLDKPGQWLNVLIGEIPRIGFITALSVKDVEFRSGLLPGPSFGVPGLRGLLGVNRGPLLCRSTRPAFGLDTQELQRVFFEVLSNGFHAVKDDELQCWQDTAAFRSHVEAMVATKMRAEDKSGEKKLYVANLICEPWELNERLEVARLAGADALLVAPAIQGLGILPAAARETGLPLLAHNTFAEMFVRHPSWGIAPALYAKLLRHVGADWIVTPGGFAEAGNGNEDELEFAIAAQGGGELVEPSMMIIQGGKRPDGLPKYLASAGSEDFMLIVASWADTHPKGLAYAASEFRSAVDAIVAQS